MTYPVDLHTHTTRSDGHDLPEELIRSAAGLGLRALAITDHDVPPPLTLHLSSGEPISSRAYASAYGLTLILGDEFSTDTWVDDVHLCGYELDWGRPEFQAEVQAAARSKVDGYRELVERLGQQGLPLDWEGDVLGGRSEAEVQRKHIFEAMAARGYCSSWSEAKLRVRNDPSLNVRRRKIDPLACIDLIHACGGVAVLAHPYLIDDPVRVPGQADRSRHDYIAALFEAGLDGIEARYTYNKTTYSGCLTPEAIEAEVRQAWRDKARFFSGGSDYHAGQKAGEKKLRALGERGLSLPEFRPVAEALGIEPL